jgi:E3 ubiquitin-protein ligase DOA10
MTFCNGIVMIYVAVFEIKEEGGGAGMKQLNRIMLIYCCGKISVTRLIVFRKVRQVRGMISFEIMNRLKNKLYYYCHAFNVIHFQQYLFYVAHAGVHMND